LGGDDDSLVIWKVNTLLLTILTTLVFHCSIMSSQAVNS